MKSKEDIDLIASAAAKLALQQLDPVARKKRQEFTSGLPQGQFRLYRAQDFTRSVFPEKYPG